MAKTLKRDERYYGTKLLQALIIRGITEEGFCKLVQSDTAIESLAEAAHHILFHDRITSSRGKDFLFNDRVLENFYFPAEMKEALGAAGMTSIGIIALQTRSFMESIDGIGELEIEKIEYTLSMNGLTFRPENGETIAQKADRYRLKSPAVRAYLKQQASSS